MSQSSIRVTTAKRSLFAIWCLGGAFVSAAAAIYLIALPQTVTQPLTAIHLSDALLPTASPLIAAWPTQLQFSQPAIGLAVLSIWLLFSAYQTYLQRPLSALLWQSASMLGLCLALAAATVVRQPPRVHAAILVDADQVPLWQDFVAQFVEQHAFSLPPTIDVIPVLAADKLAETGSRTLAALDPASARQLFVATSPPTSIHAQLEWKRVVAFASEHAEVPVSAPNWSLDELNKTSPTLPAQNQLVVDPVVLLHQDTTITLRRPKTETNATTMLLSANDESIDFTRLASSDERDAKETWQAKWRPKAKGLAHLVVRDAKSADAVIAQEVAWVTSPPLVWWLGDVPQSVGLSVLRASELKVEVLTGDQATAQRFSGERPDLVVVANTSAYQLGRENSQALLDYVRDGGGLLFVDSPNAYGKGNWQNSALYPEMPVSWTGEIQEEEPENALMLVIDRSGSMASDARLALVKDAARRTAQTLVADDWLGIVAFDDQPINLAPLQPARHRARITGAIERLSPGGGTDVVPAVREAFSQLQAVAAKNKHMIVLSDGQSPHAGVRELIGELVRANVTISTVGVGRGAGQELLAAMAQQGGGRFYFSQDGTDVPQIFARDTQSFAKASNVRKVFPVSRGSSFLPLPGVQLSQAPPLLSLIKLRVRPGAQTYLHSRDQMPVLTAKRFGQGTIAAFASDVGPGLSQAWGAWSDFPRLWLAIARAVARQETAEESLELAILRNLDGHSYAIEVASPQVGPLANSDDAQQPWAFTLYTPSEPEGTALPVEVTRQALGQWRAAWSQQIGEPAIVRVFEQNSQGPSARIGIVRIDYNEQGAPASTAKAASFEDVAPLLVDLIEHAPASSRPLRIALAPWLALAWVLPTWLAGLVLARRRLRGISNRS